MDAVYESIVEGDNQIDVADTMGDDDEVADALIDGPDTMGDDDEVANTLIDGPDTLGEDWLISDCD